MKQKIKEIYSHRIFSPVHGYPTKIRYLRHYCSLMKKYGKAAPRPEEKFHVKTDNLNYSVPSRELPDNAPIYGILKGKWDEASHHWKNTFFEGLEERFKQEKNWEETQYYHEGIKKLETGKEFNPLNGEKTKENFENYLKEIEDLFKDIKNSGYDEENPITANIGRNGEYLCHQGNHRRIISIILGIDEIPVKIKYRHKKWQEKRMKAVKNQEELEEKYRNHPDIEYLQKKPDHKLV